MKTELYEKKNAFAKLIKFSPCTFFGAQIFHFSFASERVCVMIATTGFGD